MKTLKNQEKILGTREEKTKNDILTFLEKTEEKTTSNYRFQKLKGKLERGNNHHISIILCNEGTKLMRDNALYLQFGSDKGETK